jgi:hypothetical protein
MCEGEMCQCARPKAARLIDTLAACRADLENVREELFSLAHAFKTLGQDRTELRLTRLAGLVDGVRGKLS